MCLTLNNQGIIRSLKIIFVKNFITRKHFLQKLILNVEAFSILLNIEKEQNTKNLQVFRYFFISLLLSEFYIVQSCPRPDTVICNWFYDLRYKRTFAHSCFLSPRPERIYCDQTLILQQSRKLRKKFTMTFKAILCLPDEIKETAYRKLGGYCKTIGNETKNLSWQETKILQCN